MRKLWLGIVATMLMVVFVAPASAYEFSMKGTWLWGYDYMAEGGNNHFFGQHDYAPNLNIVTGPHWRAMNAWVGARFIDNAQYGIVTGKDASLNWMRMQFDPEFRVNNAVRIRGAYQIGGPRAATNTSGPTAFAVDSQFGLYPNSLNYGAWQPISHGSWTQLWMTAQTPWGVLIAGKRPFAFGMGVQYDGSQATAESLGVIAPYGPFRIGLVIYPWRGQTWVNSQSGRAIISSVSDVGMANGAQATPTTITGAGALGAAVERYRLWDNEAKRQLQPGVFFTYDNGPLSLGAVYEWLSLHNSPAGATTLNNAANTARTHDMFLEDGSAFIKYNNGRFFANMELAWVRGGINVQPGINDPVTYDQYGAYFTNDGQFGQAVAPRYLEAWKLGAEVGALCGPAKISLLWSWVPGPDRRQGVWINNQSWENVANGSFLANPQMYLPYSLLMGYQYGAGLNAVSRSGEGFMTDANSYGARLDYAAAANLNLYFTGFYADRVSNGWPWGVMTLQSQQATAAGGGGQTVLLGQGALGLTTIAAPQNAGGQALSAPNIPDNSLGWELTAGVDWKLLEGFKTTFRGAYWQPGAWFKYACVDKGLASSVPATPGTVIAPLAADGNGIGSQWSVNPARTIDPIYMFQGTMQVDF